MKLDLDHFFVCTEPGAPEADELVRFGLREGPPNQHPGQGTENRRFPFANAMIELLWVSDPTEAQSPGTRRTLLWERCSGCHSGASPFGICLRPATLQSSGDAQAAPFPGWAYKPSYLPHPLQLHIGDAPVDEPMWVYLGFMRRQNREEHFIDHPNGIREITGLVLNTPAPLRSETSRIIVDSGILSARAAKESLLEVEFDRRSRGQSKDLRPALPLVFHF
jgi:hypothetical protein